VVPEAEEGPRQVLETIRESASAAQPPGSESLAWSIESALAPEIEEVRQRRPMEPEEFPSSVQRPRSWLLTGRTR